MRVQQQILPKNRKLRKEKLKHLLLYKQNGHFEIDMFTRSWVQTKPLASSQFKVTKMNKTAMNFQFSSLCFPSDQTTNNQQEFRVTETQGNAR